MFESALAVLKIINIQKYDAFIVGGAVRDIMLGIDPSDIDISTNMPIKELQRLFVTYEIGTSKNFGIIGIKFNSFCYEVANFRTEFGSDDSRHPKHIKIAKTFKEDSSRRDFTINAMAIDKDGNIVDFHGGHSDIKDKILKFIGEPSERIKEDSLRILRAVRIASKLNFNIEKNSIKALMCQSDLLLKLPAERIYSELYKMACDKSFYKCIQRLSYLKLLKILIPELNELQDFFHSLDTHPEANGNVFGHVLETIKAADSNNPFINLACLFHDIGKIKTFEIDENKRPRYINHEIAGLEIFDSIADKLKMDNDTREIIKFCIEHHMKIHHLAEMKNSKVARLINHPYWNILFTVGEADEFARGIEKVDKVKWFKILEKIDKVKNNSAVNLSKTESFITGDKIMSLCNIKPSKIVGQIKEKITDMIIDGEIKLEEVNDTVLKLFQEV